MSKEAGKGVGLSKREKNLLLIACLMVFVYILIKFVVYPLYSEYSKKTDLRDNLSIEKSDTENKIAGEALAVKNLENALKNLEKIRYDIYPPYESGKYPDFMPNEEIDRVITGLCLQSNLSILSLRIGDAGKYEIMVSKEKEEESIETTAIMEKKALSYFMKNTVSMRVNGNYNALRNLLDRINKTDFIRVTQASFTNYRAENSDITLYFEIVMINNKEEAKLEE